MKHLTTDKFWHCFENLPVNIQTIAKRNFELLKLDAAHPSLQLKRIHSKGYYSVRVNLNYRALGLSIDEGILWFWIGNHSDYDVLLR